MAPRAILFDLDDTILAYGVRPLLLLEVAEEYRDAARPLAPREVADCIEVRSKIFWADPARHQVWRQRLAEARRLVVRDAFAELAGRAPGLTRDCADRFAQRFHDYRGAQIKPFPSAEKVIGALKNQGVKLALVTNGAGEMQRAKIARFNLARFFDHIQIEGEAGFGKPEERAYLHAMQTLGVGPRETWMVGDNLEWEVAAPQRLGIFAIWHDHLGAGLPPDSAIVPDKIIRDLSELLPMVGALTYPASP